MAMGKMRRVYKRKEGKASKALRKVNKLNRLFKPEMKYATILENSQSVSFTGTTEAHLTGIANTGTSTALTRDGNQILALSAEVKGYVHAHASSTVSIIRVILVKDNQQVADTSPSFVDVFGSSTPTVLPSVLRQKRFTILRDQTFDIPMGGDAIKHFKWNVKLGHEVRYNDSAATDIQKGGVYLMAISNEGTYLPSLIFSARVKFYDF